MKKKHRDIKIRRVQLSRIYIFENTARIYTHIHTHTCASGIAYLTFARNYSNPCVRFCRHVSPNVSHLEMTAVARRFDIRHIYVWVCERRLRSCACNLPCIQTFQMHDTWTFRGVPYMEDTYIHLTWYAWRDSPIWRAILFSRMIMRAVAVFVRRYESRLRAISRESHYERMKRIAQKYFSLAAILEIVQKKN